LRLLLKEFQLFRRVDAVAEGLAIGFLRFLHFTAERLDKCP
jgi:hypothetical protein